MSDCQISRKELETYPRIKKLIEINKYKEDDLIQATSTPLMIHFNDTEPNRYECLSDAANDIKVSRQTLMYAHNNKIPLVTRRKGGAKVFYIKWLED